MAHDITGHLILLLAPSGSGKGQLITCMDGFKDNVYFAKTYTSRRRREGVAENPLYEFISEAEFEQMKEDGLFVEWAEFGGNLYGTPKSEILDPMSEGKVVFKEMELQGVKQIQKLIPKEYVTVMYVDAGGWDVLKRRVTGRAQMSEEELELRRQRYEEESRFMPETDVIVKNYDGKLEAAKGHFCSVVQDIINQHKS